MTTSTMSIEQRGNPLTFKAGLWLAPLLLVAGLLFLASPARSQTAPTATAAFLMAADAEPNTYAFKWASLIYTEAFRRLGIPVQIATYSLARRSAMTNEGSIDGEVSRIYSYAEGNSHLIRVEEPVMEFTFALFTANPGLRLQRVEELAASNLMVEHRRGILMCENTLKKVVPAERLSNVTTTEQGVKKLIAGRTDVYCDIDVYVPEVLHSPEFKGVTSVRKLFKIASVPTYPYLHKKHVALAPRLAATLKQMKIEGLLDAYPLQAEREMGWTR